MLELLFFFSFSSPDLTSTLRMNLMSFYKLTHAIHGSCPSLGMQFTTPASSGSGAGKKTSQKLPFREASCFLCRSLSPRVLTRLFILSIRHHYMSLLQQKNNSISGFSQISTNGKLFYEYKHRMSFDKVDRICVIGMVDLNLVTYHHALVRNKTTCTFTIFVIYYAMYTFFQIGTLGCI